MRVSTMTVILFTSLLPRICSAIDTPDTEAVQEPIAVVQDNVETPEDPAPILAEGGVFTRETLANGLDSLAYYLGFIADFDGYLTRALGSLIGRSSKTGPCNVFSGVLGRQGEVTYRYQTNGVHCYTANEKKTVLAAIVNSIKEDEIPATGTKCLDLTQKPEWDDYGYLLIGRTEGFDHDIYCGPEFKFTPVEDLNSEKNSDRKEEL